MKRIDHIVLRVKDLDVMKNFYETVMGMDVIHEDEGSVTLDNPKLTLVKGADVVNKEAYNGLYHHAYLLPSLKDLGTFLIHLKNFEVTWIGGSDHGFSKAIYFRDPEHNAIEVYVDMDPSVWPMADNNKIRFVTQRLDMKAIRDLSDAQFTKLPKETIWGHVHLEVDDIEKGRPFYIDTLGFEVKIETGPSLFMSKDGYHHHIAMNNWHHAKGLLPNNYTGIISYTLLLPELPAQTLTDPFGIIVKINED